jgi:hypothetical protein
METEPKKPRLNTGRVLIIVLGILTLIYALGMLNGGLSNYQTLKEGAATQYKDALPSK